MPTDDGSQGRTDLYVGPGVTWIFAADWSASLDVRVRAVGYTVNAQLNMPLTIELSIVRLFHLEQGFNASLRLSFFIANRQAHAHFLHETQYLRVRRTGQTPLSR